MKTEQLIVDNRVFLLGLDDLYRVAMKEHESEELLVCAEETAKTLSVEAADVPIEGYYAESPELTRYFSLMRALQDTPIFRESEVADSKKYQRLKQVTSSPIFGPSAAGRTMFSPGKDALACALESTFPVWTIPHLTDVAYEIAINSDDFSLVTLTVLSKDPVVISACRETMVLYAMAFGAGPGLVVEYEYVWRVDEIIERRARSFVAAFNKLMDESLPVPCAANAERYYSAHVGANIDGRCVRIGFDDLGVPIKHYHWAIDCRGGEYQVKDFWDTELWTTERYQEKQRSEG